MVISEGPGDNGKDRADSVRLRMHEERTMMTLEKSLRRGPKVSVSRPWSGTRDDPAVGACENYALLSAEHSHAQENNALVRAGSGAY
jgi:hypothetical protein